MLRGAAADCYWFFCAGSPSSRHRSPRSLDSSSTASLLKQDIRKKEQDLLKLSACSLHEREAARRARNIN
jgi:hypothetical protein